MSEEKQSLKKDYSWRLKGRVIVPDHEQRQYEDLWFCFGARGFELLKLKEGVARIDNKGLNLSIFPLTDMFLYQSVIQLDPRKKIEFSFKGPAIGSIYGDTGYPDAYKEEEKAPLPITSVNYLHEFLHTKIFFNISGEIGTPAFYPFYKDGPKNFKVEFETNKQELERAFEFSNLANNIWEKHKALKDNL